MRNRIAQQAARDAREAAQADSNGLYRSVFSPSSEADILHRVADISKLPVAVNTTELQDADGNFYFLLGYSQVGGPDKLR